MLEEEELAWSAKKSWERGTWEWMWRRVRDSYCEKERQGKDGPLESERGRKKKEKGTRTNQSVEEVDETTSLVLHGDSDRRDVGDEDGRVGRGNAEQKEDGKRRVS